MPNALQSPVPLTEQDDNATDDLREILAGLSHDPKFISSKFFYDERGSELFEQICELPEYYLTQTELGIMQANKTEMAAAIGPEASLIEFGSGSSRKIRILLETWNRLRRMFLLISPATTWSWRPTEYSGNSPTSKCCRSPPILRSHSISPIRK